MQYDCTLKSLIILSISWDIREFRDINIYKRGFLVFFFQGNTRNSIAIRVNSKRSNFCFIICFSIPLCKIKWERLVTETHQVQARTYCTYQWKYQCYFLWVPMLPVLPVLPLLLYLGTDTSRNTWPALPRAQHLVCTVILSFIDSRYIYGIIRFDAESWYVRCTIKFTTKI